MPGYRNATPLLILWFCLLPSRIMAQGLEAERLPVSGSLVYHALLHGSGTAVGLRFAGRVSVAVAPRSYVGFTVGSWNTFSQSFETSEGLTISGDLQAVAYLVYAQHYVLSHGFVRAGAGLGDTRSVLPRDSRTVLVEGSLLPAAAVGAGWDMRLRRYLFLTLSADYAHIFGSRKPPDELGRALMLGIALTLR